MEKLQSVVRYEIFIFVGLLMAIGTLLKLLHLVYIDSDWFWFLAGLGLMVEGAISYARQKQFSRKFKVISISEEMRRSHQ